ncbi:MAG: aminotransferase class IV, partial [Gammaproteobacteria bacterium]
MQTPEVIINGQQGDQISCFDRGLLYGDGIFETIAIKHHKPQYWEDHLQRLQLGCKTLELQGLDVALLEKEIKFFVDSESESKFVVKIIITRGVGGRGYRPTLQSLTRIVQKFPWPGYPSSFTDIGIKVTKCSLQLSKQSKLAQIKHLNRLEQVLARSEWEDDYQ